MKYLKTAGASALFCLGLPLVLLAIGAGYGIVGLGYLLLITPYRIRVRAAA
jgi:hypothetical protein